MRKCDEVLFIPLDVQNTWDGCYRTVGSSIRSNVAYPQPPQYWTRNVNVDDMADEKKKKIIEYGSEDE